MEDDDSQDELINRSKAKRAVVWPISDDSDDVEEESEEGESDSDEEDPLDGEDEEEEEGGNEEEDGMTEEEAEDCKSVGGAFGETSADLVGMSSDEDSDRCPICLNSFSSQPVATPENCEHFFCLDCILEWAKNANSCPVDRNAFNNIYLRKCYGGKVKKMITVQKPVKEGQEETVNVDLEQTSCEMCGGSDREDRLLLCDGCDAGYHMECLTPPLDSVPVEEWFCPQCEVNNRRSRGSAEEHSFAESLPSTARSAIRHSQPHGAGPTRAIARTQQSERVRANVNRHRITQARTSQLAPTYLMRSTWLDETINAVIAGLNTSVYIRDFTPRVPSTHRRRTRKRRRIKSKKTSSAAGKTGKASSTGVRRRKRKVRRTKSRKKQMLKKAATPQGRIANQLGIVKDKKSSSIPTVYRPSEHTLSSMRADIGAASLSIYGDPFDLDPFVDCEEVEQEGHVTSLLEAKRRGISRSALRSHQPVARPVTASVSRRGMDVPRSGGVVEAAPVPDLLGSILSGQSMLLMDSSDVVINRDGSLKATKPTVMPSALKAGSNKSSSSGDASTQISQGMSPSPSDSCPSLHYNRDLPGISHSSTNRLFTPSSAPFMFSANHTQQPTHSDLPPRSVLSPHLNRDMHFPGDRATTDVRTRRESASSSVPSVPDSRSKSRGMASSQSQPKKAPTKPMWIDVSVLPRIPKIKKESSGFTNDDTSQRSNSTINGGRGNNGSSTTSSNGYSMPETGIHSLAQDKSRQPSVDHQKGTSSGQSQRHRPDGAGPSSAFSSSFSSSSSTSYPASQPRYSSSSSAVSFRINPSGNSWHSRRLSIPSSSASECSTQGHWRKKEEEARKRQLHKDKQMLLASHTMINKEQDSNNMYDPFNPTLSDSSSSDGEAESSSLDSSSQHATHKEKASSLGNKDGLMRSKLDLVRVKTETQEMDISQEEPTRDLTQETISQEVRCKEEYVKIEKESRLVDIKVEKQTELLETKACKVLDDVGEGEKSCHAAHPSLDLLKTEKDSPEEESGQNVGTPNTAPPSCKNDSSASSSAATNKKQKSETKSDSVLLSKSPSRDLGVKKKTSKTSKEQLSSNSETDRGRRGNQHASGQGARQKEKERDRERSFRRSSSRERRRARSTSESSESSSPDRTRRKRQQSQSWSKDRKRSRSRSSSSSRERSRRKKCKQSNKERNYVRERDHERGQVSKKTCGRSRSWSRSRSRSRECKPGKTSSKSRSRSRERRRDHARLQQPSLSSRDEVDLQSQEKRKHRSRSSSRERRKDEGSSRGSQRTPGSCASSSADTKQLQDKKKQKDATQSSLKEGSFAKVKKQLSSCTSTSKAEKEGKNLRADSQVTTAEITKEMGFVKEIKKERQTSLDMFEDSPFTKPLKKEEKDNCSMSVTKGVDDKGIKEDSTKTLMCEIKSETLEITSIKLEPGSPETCHLPTVTSFSTLTTPVTVNSLQDALSQSQPGLMSSAEPPDTAELTVSVKQEQPSDSDDDFSVDVMLDSLDNVKFEHTEGNAASVKHENEVEEGRNEGDQGSATVVAKSKTQVKRVTWNIQEPEGPQIEKSASKLALYKLKLKQEGVRRPSLTVQTSSQDNTRAVDDPTTSSRVDSLNLEGSSATGQGEAEQGDLQRKQYLKKLHMQERAIEEVKLAIKPFYQRRDINKDEYKEILRKAVHKVCHSKSGEINPVKVGNLVKAYVDKYKHARKHKKGEDLGKAPELQTEAMKTSDSP